ncbi:GIY-YIG nuclease family protein [Sphingobacterium sp. LRF_L2]|uniref:GIY-YIG nuclease family protein n=1 Tax=Sphingobacterium sp. LRF_L2 TaxID=3369421 RepID=UPI003F61D03F
MERHFVYIITDSNRTYLEVGYCNDIQTRLQEIRDTSNVLFSGTPKLTNVVYLEEYHALDKAIKQQQQLNFFTRMQREKLIRLKNPNWLNLGINTTIPANKKVVVYAS